MNRPASLPPLSHPRPGENPFVTPEGIICGTDGKYRWVCETAQSFGLFRGKPRCVLFTMDEHIISFRQVKGRVSQEEVTHAFAVWVGGQSQPALRFNPPRQMTLDMVRRIIPIPDRYRIRLRGAGRGLCVRTAPEQFGVILDHLTRHCPRAELVR